MKPLCAKRKKGNHIAPLNVANSHLRPNCEKTFNFTAC